MNYKKSFDRFPVQPVDWITLDHWFSTFFLTRTTGCFLSIVAYHLIQKNQSR